MKKGNNKKRIGIKPIVGLLSPIELNRMITNANARLSNQTIAKTDHPIDKPTIIANKRQYDRLAIYKAIEKSLFNHAMVKRDEVKKEKNYSKIGNITKGISFKSAQRRPNTSSTSETSTLLENAMFTKLDNYRKKNNYRTRAFDIPRGKTIKLQIGTGRSTDVSINALDTLAKYAGRTKTSLNVMVGLPYHETNFGEKPIFNYDTPYIKKLPHGNTVLGNADYFKAFDYIPQEYLVRDFRYNSDLSNGKEEMIPLSIPPMHHAFDYFAKGKYNPGDRNYEEKVINAGKEVWKEKTGNLKRWWFTEGKKYYQDGIRWHNYKRDK